MCVCVGLCLNCSQSRGEPGAQDLGEKAITGEPERGFISQEHHS